MTDRIGVDMNEAIATRKCSECGQRRPAKDFYPAMLPSGRGFHCLKCRYCVRAYMNARSARQIAYIQKIKLDAGCMDCGLKSPYPEVFDFDHRPGVVKVGKIGQLMMQSMAKVIAEIAKCDVVCANCHRIRTVDRRLARGGPGTFGVDRPRRRQPDPIPDDLPPMLDFDWPN